MFGKRTVKMGTRPRSRSRSRSASRSASRSPPTAYEKWRNQQHKLTGNNNSNKNAQLNYARVNYNIPYFILPNGTIISRFSLYGAVRPNVGLKRNQVPENKLVNWLLNQQKLPVREFIRMPHTGRIWSQKNIRIVNK